MKRNDGRQTGDSGKQRTLGDLFSLTRVNYILYVFIIALAIFILYFVITQYLVYSGQLPKAPLEAEMTRNDVDSFADGFHPVIVITSSARQPSIIQIKLDSKVYNVQQSSGEYVNNYTAFFILPNNTFSTDFNMTVTASGEKSGFWTERQAFRTQENSGVLFRVG